MGKGFWDFKSYDEQRWFRFLVLKTVIVALLYFFAHIALNSWVPKYSYEYTVLDQDQLQMINRIYSDASKPKADAGKGTASPTSSTSPKAKKGTGTAAKADSLKKKDSAALASLPADTGAAKSSEKGPGPSQGMDTSRIRKPVCMQVMDYLDNIFENKIEPGQKTRIMGFLCELKAEDAPAFLGKVRFEIRSYFWLTGPCVYVEIIFWSILGVLASLLFNLGVLSKNATTDLGNPQSYFDSSEIPFQVAKVLYAPICTLVVILGYNYFSNQNIVDISSSKGVLVFAFICGFYSSRVIALMDRLKEVLLPNSGTSTLPGTPPAPGANALIASLTVKAVPADALLTAAEIATVGADWLNHVVVTLKSTVTGAVLTGSRMAIDPPGSFTFKDVQPGNYTITADFQHPAGGAPIHLEGTKTGQISSGKAAVEVKLERL
ncbi:hypothetical protein SAMN05192574_105241 [Mucilaginibacter gossypiicola]|uniref:Uncharacterized protein n=1 Tax=Mucilaginibacter gossypiicola TaxID=551995 RepID=A0A1H8LU29_9SPHI|nr:hypothetical protein [Mucilaginibacter gossypiicola]SEO08376.1 hypothetical protein SAMN05192574_105241 [Mucilaginibacter gossypiicola]